jgi:hypothetical protein
MCLKHFVYRNVAIHFVGGHKQNYCSVKTCKWNLAESDQGEKSEIKVLKNVVRG